MGDGYRRLVELVKRSHEREYVKKQNLKLGAQYFRTLRKAGIVQFFPRGAPEGVRVRISPDLQRDFSLHQTLSLYLVETLGRLDPALPTYAQAAANLAELQRRPLRVIAPPRFSRGPRLRGPRR